MLSKSESHTSWQESVISSTWLTYILEEWTGVEYHYLYYIGFIWCVLNIIFFAPFLIFISGSCFINLLLHIYKKKNGLDEDFSNKSWDNGRFMVASILNMCGKLGNGYELHGIEKIPEGPGLIVYYHGAIPLDYCFFISNLYIQTGRLCYSAVDRFFAKLPGGSREAFFSDENYNLLWGNRKGFAQVAIDAKVPIIPLFTQNIREGYRTFGKIGFFRWFYERSRVLLIPGYGGFPVKLRTYVGDPIPYDPNITATELVEKTKIAIETLRDRHQKLPGSILRALLERFDKHQKED
ncbi:transmembrane protein 68-like isoform X2 [Malaclemys terrapin pileata]|uniref:transmembrane protein 68-like isoform X2 n=1 Tax=Malaclemys terrapin pileata TaxID=2991368 RepID=UPI0023A7F0CE|nr:transmembrane protein 68-like isoform X2 [Malaclemys terrapin pileata]